MTAIKIIENHIKIIENRLNEFKNYDKFIKKHGFEPQFVGSLILKYERRLLKEILIEIKEQENE